MRLISQTGDIDIPYENASLSRAENIIRAWDWKEAVEIWNKRVNKEGTK